MLDSALAAAAVAFAATTLLFLAVGRRALAGRRARVIGVGAFAIVALVGSRVAGGVDPGESAAILAIGLLALAMPRAWYVPGALFFGSLLGTVGLYSVYLLRATLLLGSDPLSAVVGLILLVLELAAMGLILASAFEMVDAIGAPPSALPPTEDPQRWPIVCVQVPTYNEPPELVIQTIRALAALDYPALRIQVIDNNTTDEGLWRPVEAACARLRKDGLLIEFAHLPEWPGFKAGALNWGLARLDPDVEIVGIVDADYLVEPDWLRATVPYFGDRAVSFVQTPQDYRDWKTSSFYSACHVAFAYFFKVGMVSRAHRNAIIFAGTMGLVRRPELDAIGGWDERIITEDAAASLRILERGSRAIYVPRAYGHGIMPLTYEGLRKQRFRWAFGGIQILRHHWRSLVPWNRRSGLTLGQRYDYLVGGLGWFNDGLTLGFTIFVAVAAVGAIIGRPFVVQRLSAIGLVLPVAFVLLNLMRYLWALRATTGASYPLALAGLRVNLSLSWVVALACLRGLTQERGVFLRTPKFRGAAAIREVRLVWVETALAAVALCLAVGLLLRAGYAPVGLALTGLLTWSLLIYGSAMGYALGDPTRAPLSDVLRQKANLELDPRVGRAIRSRPARAGFAIAGLLGFLLIGAVALESGRPPIAELPFREVPRGPLGAFEPSPAATDPGASPSPSRGAPRPEPSATPRPAGSGPRPTSLPGASTGPTAGPAASPTPPPSPIVPLPTPAPTPPVPVPSPSPGRTPPVPIPSHSPPRP